MILRRPDYQSALNYAEWVHLNNSVLMNYWIDCDEAVIQQGGPAASVDEFEDFCRTQWDQFVLAQFNDEEPEESGDYDPTPWCDGCGARKKEDCHCGPLAENE